MIEASKLCAYSQEYLSLLARRGKIFSKKIGRNWYTTREAVDNYLKTQSVFISLPKNIFGRLNAQANLISSLTPEEPEKGEPVEHSEHSKIFEEFERLNPQISFDVNSGKEIKQQNPTVTKPEAFVVQKPGPVELSRGPSSGTRTVLGAEEELVAPVLNQMDPVLEKLDKLSDSFGNFAEKVTEKINQPVVIKTQVQNSFTSKEKEFIEIESQSLSFRFRK